MSAVKLFQTAATEITKASVLMTVLVCCAIISSNRKSYVVYQIVSFSMTLSGP